MQMEYAEMPELALTPAQAQRLWNLSSELCDRALTALTRAGYLVRTAEGTFIRRGAPPMTVAAIESLVRAM
jgi:hypothetical protein